MTEHRGKLKFRERLEVLLAAAGSPKPAAICSASRDRLGRTSLSVQRISDWRSGKHIPTSKLFRQFLRAVDTLARQRNIILPAALADSAAWDRLLRAARAKNPAPAQEESRHITAGTVQIPIRPVTDAKPLELGVHRTSRLEGAPSLPTYVPRDVDSAVTAQLMEARENGGLVLLVGESTAGKSRCAFEAVRRELSDHWIIAPPAASELSPVLSHISLPKTGRRKWVLWLDDLDRFLLPGGLDQGMLSALLEQQVVVIATMRSEVYGNYSERAFRGMEAGVASARRLGSRVLNLIEPLVLDRQWSEAEMTRLRAHLEHPDSDGRLADAARHHGVHGIAEYLAAGPKLLEEFQTTRRQPNGHPRGAALVQAAIDLARAGISTPLHAETLLTLSTCYLTAGDASRLRAESPEQALIWATEIQFGVAGMLVATETAEAWRPFDYLVDTTASAVETADIPDEVWEAAVTHANGGSELLPVGRSAFRFGRLVLAERCFSPLAARGDHTAMHDLGFVQRERRSEHTWPSWYRTVSETGTPLQARALGALHEVESRWDEAASCYERAAAQGDILAMRLRGVIAQRRRQHEEAHEWYVRAAEGGDAVAIASFNAPGIYRPEKGLELGSDTWDPDLEWDEEDDEPWRMTARTSRILSCNLQILADTAHDELDELGDQPISPNSFGIFFARLPASTWGQPRPWRRRVLRALDDLNEDITLGLSPEPRCAAEELALHFALQSASAMTCDEPDLVAEFTRGIPEQRGDYDWSTCSDLLFQDHDVLFLYDPVMQGLEHPDAPLNRHMGMGDLRPEGWFEEFGNVSPRDPTRGFVH
ncbi:tetratricopeptide repeat protein [Streptomyces kronopolitis]|uniref:tetratricopeptide repeat protein n=1 Tax=Streptomyces kronopolitis TaxID=1612435 RepID=UPI0020C02AE7|nr:hypothetical protein [Streptomyces kronopolitis]MCL6297624.1 hypothetical protein [Streptomyces kronopolitis]